jgi:hypothetical protein
MRQELMRFFTGCLRRLSRSASMYCDDRSSTFPEKFTLDARHEAPAITQEVRQHSQQRQLQHLFGDITASCGYHPGDSRPTLLGASGSGSGVRRDTAPGFHSETGRMRLISLLTLGI